MVCENSDALGDCPLEQIQLKSKVSCSWVMIRLTLVGRGLWANSYRVTGVGFSLCSIGILQTE